MTWACTEYTIHAQYIRYMYIGMCIRFVTMTKQLHEYPTSFLYDDLRGHGI